VSVMVRRQSAAVVVVLALLAGFFLGFETGNLVFSPGPGQGSAGAVTGAAMPGQGQTPPPGMKDQVKNLEDQAAANPKDPQAWVALGNMYFDLDNPAKAVEAYQKGLTIKPDQPDVWTDMGVMQRALKKYPEALASFDKAVALNPRHEIARLNQGVVYLYDLGQPEQAAKVWKELLVVNPEAVLPGGKRVADVVAEIEATDKSLKPK